MSRSRCSLHIGGAHAAHAKCNSNSMFGSVIQITRRNCICRSLNTTKVSDISYPSTYHLPIYWSLFPKAICFWHNLSPCLPADLVFLPIGLYFSLSICLPIYPSIVQSIFLPICLTFPSVKQIHPSIYIKYQLGLSVYVSVPLPASIHPSALPVPAYLSSSPSQGVRPAYLHTCICLCNHSTYYLPWYLPTWLSTCLVLPVSRWC